MALILCQGVLLLLLLRKAFRITDMKALIVVSVHIILVFKINQINYRTIVKIL